MSEHAPISSFSTLQLRDDVREEYSSQLDVARHHIVWANNTLHVLTKIAEFPFDLLLPDDYTCWSLLVSSTYEACVLSLCRMLVDRRRDVFSLEHLARSTQAWMRLDSDRQALARAVKDVRERHGVTALLRDLKKQRDGLVAHLNHVAAVNGREGAVPRVTLQGLRRACDFMNELFDVLAFDGKYTFLFGEYDPAVTWPGTDSRSDVERILDWLAEQSPVVTMPEEQPDYWPHYREQLGSEAVEVVNRWRVRLGRAYA